jgi:hypothetical protein
MSTDLTDAQVFGEERPTDILPMGGGYDWRCWVPRHGPYFLCKDGLPLRDNSRWNQGGWRVCSAEIGDQQAVRLFAEHVANLEARLKEALEILRPFAEAADGYEDHAPDEQGCSGPVLLDVRRARGFLAKMGDRHG